MCEGATFHGDITSRSERLEAEERLDELDGQVSIGRSSAAIAGSAPLC